MFVTVLINNYNYARYLPEAVDSVLGQTYENWELVIVDDGSSDESRDVIEKYDRENDRVRAIYQENGGQASAIEVGFQAAKGEIVALLDADDYYDPGYLQRIVEVYQEHPSCDMLLTGLQEFGASTKKVLSYGISQLTDLGFTTLGAATGKVFMGERTSAVSLRRSVIERILPLPFHEDWRLCADWALARATCLARVRKFYLPEPLAYYRIHDSNSWMSRDLDPCDNHSFLLSCNRLTRYYSDKFDYHSPLLGRKSLPYLLYKEARTGDKPESILRSYIKAIKESHGGWFYRRRYVSAVKKLLRRS